MKAAILSLFAIVLLIPAIGRGADEATSQPTTNSSDAAGASKFYGAITAVDKDAKTFVIDNVTYSIVGETHMTKAADDSQATIDDAVVGEPARGTFTKSADGKNNVTKVRFGKKTGGGKSGGGKSGGKKSKDAASQPATAQ
jgi:hypothetical protein